MKNLQQQIQSNTSIDPCSEKNDHLNTSSKPSFSPLTVGIFFAIVAALAFGTNPLFARMLYAQGFSVDSVLLFRFCPAAGVMGFFLLFRDKSLRIPIRKTAFCIISGLLFCMTSWALFQSYKMMDIGIAATLLFVYPVLVTVISAVCFREKVDPMTLIALILAVAGVTLLSLTPHNTASGISGIAMALLSAFFYAGYIVVVGLNKKYKVESSKLTFYVLATCVVFYTVKSFFGSLQIGNFNTVSLLNIAGLSIISAGISLACVALALKRCSATIVAVLGALEPLSATFWGIVVFGEKLNLQIIIGMGMILISVFVIACLSRHEKN